MGTVTAVNGNRRGFLLTIVVYICPSHQSPVTFVKTDSNMKDLLLMDRYASDSHRGLIIFPCWQTLCVGIRLETWIV